jgi:hypothetical protein
MIVSNKDKIGDGGKYNCEIIFLPPTNISLKVISGVSETVQ